MNKKPISKEEYEQRSLTGPENASVRALIQWFERRKWLRGRVMVAITTATATLVLLSMFRQSIMDWLSGGG